MDVGVWLSNEYVRAFVILVAVYLVVRLIIWVIAKLLPRFTAATEAKWDDELLEKVSGPATWIAMLVGVRFALGQIAFVESYQATVVSILYTLMIIAGGVLVYYIIDTLILIGFTSMAKKARVRVNESLIQFFHSIVKFIVIVAVFLAVLANWGVQIGPLLAGIGVAGIAIAFALQSTLSNVFGGVSLLLDRTVQTGDLVYLDDGTAGKVMRVGLRSTRIKTFDNELVIVPNGKLSESNVKNVALPSKKTRVVIPFGVEYGADVDQVKKLVLKEIKKIKHVLDDPAPSVKFLAMGASSLDFKAYFYVDTYENRASSKDEANTRIYNVLNKAGVGIPFPQMDIHIKEHKKR